MLLLQNKVFVRKFTGPADAPDPGFNGEAMKQSSIAAAGLCDWVVNIMIYHDIFLDVEVSTAVQPNSSSDACVCASQRGNC